MAKKLVNRFFCYKKTMKSKDCSYDLSGNISCSECVEYNNCDVCIQENGPKCIGICQGCINYRDNKTGSSQR